jgi:hypothetical protein
MWLLSISVLFESFQTGHFNLKDYFKVRTYKERFSFRLACQIPGWPFIVAQITDIKQKQKQNREGKKGKRKLLNLMVIDIGVE